MRLQAGVNTKTVLWLAVAFMQLGLSGTATPPPTTSGPDGTSSSTASGTTAGPDSTTRNNFLCGLTFTANSTPSPLATPNYPYTYPSDFYCTFQLTTTSGFAIMLTFENFYLEYSYYCSYDTIKVYDGSSTSAPLLGTYCGSSIPDPIIGTATSMYLVFESDYSVEYTGANGTYMTYDNSYPNCKSGYTTYTAIKSVRSFSNSDYPNTYQSNQDEYFLVSNSNYPSEVLILELTYLSIERSSGCVYDSLTIYDGGCTSFPVYVSHCGSYLSRWELSSGSEYLVHFHTDGSIERNGFSLNYYTGPGGTASPTTTTTTLGAHVTVQLQLMEQVLTNYSSENLPARNLSSAIETSVDVSLVGINGLDEVQQKLTTTILFDIKWTDNNIQWPVSKLGGITKLLMPQNDVWKPDIALLNSFTQITQMGSKFMFVVVKNDGQCNWKPYQILESTCSVDMTNYPYDTQTCELQFSSWSASSAQVRTSVGANGMARHESFVENSEWHLQEISQRSEVINGQNTAIFSLKLKRNPSFIVFYIALPVVLLSMLNSVTFALPVDSGEKASFSITVFLSFVVYVIVTFDKMPESSDSISMFAMYILIMTCLSAFTLMISVLELRMMTLKTKHKPVTRCTIAFTNFILKLQTKMLCISKQLEQKQHEEEIERQKKKNRRQNDDDYDETDEDNVWPNFVSALDFVCFWVFLAGTLIITLGFLVNLSLQ